MFFWVPISFLNQSLHFLKNYNSNSTKTWYPCPDFNHISSFICTFAHISLKLSVYTEKMAKSNSFVKNSSKFSLNAHWQRRAVCIIKSPNYVPVLDCRPHTESLRTIELNLMDMGSKSALKLLFLKKKSLKDFEACVMYAELLSNYFFVMYLYLIIDWWPWEDMLHVYSHYFVDFYIKDFPW